MLRQTPASDRLYRLTHKTTGAVVVLRHVGTTVDEEGARIYWLCLADDPMQCLLSMTGEEMRQYDGIKLTYWGKCADPTGQLKHWFSAPDEWPDECTGPRATTEQTLHTGQNVAQHITDVATVGS